MVTPHDAAAQATVEPEDVAAFEAMRGGKKNGKPPVEAATALRGMKAICAHAGGVSASTVLKWIRNLSFPAKKIAGVEIWVSTKESINAWMASQFTEAEKPAEKQAKTSQPARW